MTTLLTRDEDKSKELEETLSKTLFRSPEDFIKAYSEGWINRNNDDVKDIAQEISETYQNVKLKGRELVFISQAEAMVDEIIEGLHPWRAITKIKRAVNDTVSVQKHGDTIYFLPDSDAGYIFYKNSEGEHVKLTNEKFFRNIDELKPIYSRYSTYASQTPNPEELPETTDTSELEEAENTNDNPFLSDDEDVESTSVDDGASIEGTDYTPEWAFKIDDFNNIDETFIEEIYELFANNR